jgi:hypothetical protein
MERRVFIASLWLDVFAAPHTAMAQQASTARIGWLAPESRPVALDPLRQALKELGGGSRAAISRSSSGTRTGMPNGTPSSPLSSSGSRWTSS